MIEPTVSHAPIDRHAKHIYSDRQFFKKLALWTLEVMGSAVGTAVIFIAMAFLQFGHDTPHLRSDLTLLQAAGLTLVILIEFGLTGFLATTLIARFAMRGGLQRLYPHACAGLYMIHSTVFFVLIGNSLFRVSDLILQLAGACLTFTCTWLGNRLLIGARTVVTQA